MIENTDRLKNMTYDEIILVPIEELGIDSRHLVSLKRAGINCAADLLEKRPADVIGVRNLGRKTLDEVIRRLDELGFVLGEQSGKKHDYQGKKKCDELRNIRVEIAKANEIDYEPEKCFHNGPCEGTCPVCDEELRYLTDEIAKKQKKGDSVKLSNIRPLTNKADLKDVQETEVGLRDTGFLRMPNMDKTTTGTLSLQNRNS